MRSGQLVILESTTYPGTTDEVLQPMLEEKGFALDKDFLLAFSPERVDPGNPQFQTHNIPKVVGGVSKDSTEVAAELYGQIVNEVHAVSSARVAEACKLWENTFRAINIGMANEMAKLCNTLGIDTWEVVRAAATKPFGFMPFFPGPGIGGHCIPLDPHYLSWKARQHGFDSQFISLAEQINSSMPAYVVKLVSTALNDVRKAVNGSRILILGVAYKKDIDDMRESPALSIIDLLRSRGAEISYHDPFVEEVTFDHAYTIGAGDPLYNQELTDDLVKASDCVIICTEHSGLTTSEFANRPAHRRYTQRPQRRHPKRKQREDCSALARKANYKPQGSLRRALFCARAAKPCYLYSVKRITFLFLINHVEFKRTATTDGWKNCTSDNIDPFHICRFRLSSGA